jgi:hyperosmotically inducible periplasmic protein
LTPLNQGTSPEDVDTTRQIRQQIMAINGLSVDAQNVKIITINGRVTLRGPVNSEDEKRQIADIAARVAPPANVDNQLQVKDAATTNSAK